MDGKVSVWVSEKSVRFEFTKLQDKICEIVMRSYDSLTADDIVCGREFIDSISQNKIILKHGIKGGEIKFR